MAGQTYRAMVSQPVSDGVERFYNKKISVRFLADILLRAAAGLSFYQDHSQLAGAVRAQHQDAFDVAGTAGAGDQRHHAGITVRVFLLHVFVSRGQIRKELFLCGQHDVMRRQDGDRPASAGFRGQEDTAGLRDQRVTGRDGDRHLFQISGRVAGIGPETGQTQLFHGAVGQRRVMAGQRIPFFLFLHLLDHLNGFRLVGDMEETGRQIFGFGGELGDHGAVFGFSFRQKWFEIVHCLGSFFAGYLL